MGRVGPGNILGFFFLDVLAWFLSRTTGKIIILPVLAFVIQFKRGEISIQLFVDCGVIVIAQWESVKRPRNCNALCLTSGVYCCGETP